MLHGRTGFDDTERTLWRIWAWTTEALGRSRGHVVFGQPVRGGEIAPPATLAEVPVHHDAPAIAVRGLRVDFALERGRTVTALEDVDLDVAAGSFLVDHRPVGLR